MRDKELPLKYPMNNFFLETNNLSTAQNRFVVEQIYEALYDYYEVFEYEPIIKMIGIRSVSGYPVPFLVVNNQANYYFTIPLFGLVHLELKERVCIYCGKHIPATNSKPFCQECDTLEKNYSNICRFEGPGTPFNTSCIPGEKLPCEELGGPVGCFSPHYVYVASLGNKIKVGISSEKRSHGIYTRLLEQGIRKAVVIRSFNNLHEALRAEKKSLKNFPCQQESLLKKKLKPLLKTMNPYI